MKITMILLVLLIWMIWSGNVLAGSRSSDNNCPGPGAPLPMPMCGGPPGGFMMGSVPGGLDVINVILHDLSLTDDQRVPIKAILDGSRDKMNAARSAVSTAQKTLGDAVKSDANEATIRSAANALGSAIGDEAVLKVQILQQIKALLTSEQLSKLEEIKAAAALMAEVNRPPRPPDANDANGPPPPPGPQP